MTTKLRAASFQDGAVTTAKIAADAVTNAKIADDAVQTENFASTVNLGRRNLMINGNMQVAQRGTSSTSTGFVTCDRFKTNKAGPDITTTQHALSTSDTPYSSGLRNSYGPTPLHAKSLEMAKKLLSELKTEVIKISKTKIPEIQKMLKEADAPYIIGQGIE